MEDLLGGEAYLDIDSFADDLNEAQNDLKNPNRIVNEKEKFNKLFNKLKSFKFCSFTNTTF